MNGRTLARDKQWSLLNIKMDVGMLDGNCLSPKNYETSTRSVIWTRDTTWKTERHSGIIANDLIPNGLVTKIQILNDEVDYFRFPFCTLPGLTPQLLD